jgi:hypothetical protein
MNERECRVMNKGTIDEGEWYTMRDLERQPDRGGAA